MKKGVKAFKKGVKAFKKGVEAYDLLIKILQKNETDIIKEYKKLFFIHGNQTKKDAFDYRHELILYVGGINLHKLVSGTNETYLNKYIREIMEYCENKGYTIDLYNMLRALIMPDDLENFIEWMKTFNKRYNSFERSLSETIRMFNNCENSYERNNKKIDRNTIYHSILGDKSQLYQNQVQVYDYDTCCNYI